MRIVWPSVYAARGSAPAPSDSIEYTRSGTEGELGPTTTRNSAASRPLPPPPPNPSTTVTLNVIAPVSYSDGVHTNVPLGRTVAYAYRSSTVRSLASQYASACAGRSASRAAMSNRTSDSAAARLSGTGSTLGASLASATCIRNVRACDAPEPPCAEAFTANACRPSCASPGTHVNVPSGDIAAPDGAPAIVYEPAAAGALPLAARTSNLTCWCSTASTAACAAIPNGGTSALAAPIHRAALAASDAAVPRSGSARSAAFPPPSAMAAWESPLPGSDSDPAPA